MSSGQCVGNRRWDQAECSNTIGLVRGAALKLGIGRIRVGKNQYEVMARKRGAHPNVVTKSWCSWVRPWGEVQAQGNSQREGHSTSEGTGMKDDVSPMVLYCKGLVGAGPHRNGTGAALRIGADTI